MKKLLLILLCLPMIGFGQNINIPDANFKAYLVGNSLINTNGDSEIQVSEATAFSSDISCSGMNISDLTGIEAFTTLTQLNCRVNQLTSLDVSTNTALTYLYCDENQLTSLDVSNNTALIDLDCGNNQLTTLDVSNNTLLEFLNCSDNQLSSIDVSGAIALREFFPEDNLLTSLDLTNNINLIEIECKNNQIQCLDVSNLLYPCELLVGNNLLEELIIDNAVVGLDATNNNLTCIQVVDSSLSFPNGVYTDIGMVFNANCSYTNLCNSPTSIEDYTTNKELLKVTDLLGREPKQTNQPLFYIYDDGTVEKRLVIE